MNPIPELISDEIYELLNSNGMIYEIGIRDYKMRKMFKELRENKVSAGDAIDKIREEYPYIQYDTIRKIVYNLAKVAKNK